MTKLVFDSLPSTGRASLAAFFARKPKGTSDALPELSAEVRGVRFSDAHLAAFRRVCKAPSGDILPLTAPHVLTSSLHLTLLAHPSFPLPLLGLVHVDNRIVQYRPVPADSPLDVVCRVDNLRSDDKGQRFDLVTECRLGDTCLWRERSTILKRASTSSSTRRQRPAAPLGEDPNPSRSTLWRVPADAGRRYAQVSGDFNPIHLTSATAKLFGFKRAIVHGMWSVARCVAEFDDEIKAMAGSPVVLDVSFKTPVFLPTHVAFHAYEEAEGLRFALRTADGVKPHLVGRLSPHTAADHTRP